jgi:hypothetical protein
VTDLIGNPINVTVSGLPGPSAYEAYAFAYLAAHNNDPTGMLSPTDWLANSGMTFNAAGINYNGGTVQQALDALNYSGMHITSMSVSPPQAEIGSSVNLNVHWTLNRNPTDQTMNGATIPSGYHDLGVNGVTVSTDYVLVSTDASAPGGPSSDTQTRSITFLNKGHAGTINKSDGGSLNSGDVNGMSQVWFADQVTRTLSFTTGADGCVWYSQPASQADPTTFRIGGFSATPVKSTRIHTTATGQSFSYNDFRLSDITAAGTPVVLEVIA